MYKGLNQYHVVMEVAQQFQQSPDALKYIYVQSSSGQEFLSAHSRTTSPRSRRWPSPIRGSFPP